VGAYVVQAVLSMVRMSLGTQSFVLVQPRFRVKIATFDLVLVLITKSQKGN